MSSGQAVSSAEKRSMDLSEMARALSESRKQVRHTCPACGQEFVAIKKARFCSHACRQQDYRARLQLAEDRAEYSTASDISTVRRRRRSPKNEAHRALD